MNNKLNNNLANGIGISLPIINPVKLVVGLC